MKRVIKFNQKAWLKPYIDMNTHLRKKTKNDFKKHFLKLMNNGLFRKIVGNIVTKYKGIKPVTTEKRRNYLVSEPNYHKTHFFFWKCTSLRNEKKHTHKDNHGWTSLVSCINIKNKQDSNIWVWYDYVKPN